MMRRLLLAGVCAASFAGAVTPARGQGIPVYDNASVLARAREHLETIGKWINQEVHNSRELTQLLETYQETRKIYNQAVVTHNAITGVRDLGSAVYAMEVAGIQNPLPVEAFAVQDMLLGRGSVSGNVGRLFDAGLSSNRVSDSSDGTFRGDELAANARSIAGIQAVSQEVYRANSDRLASLKDMRARLRTASDPKEVQDLQAAVAAIQADAASQNAQLGSAHVMFVSAQAMRGQRSAENEDRCLRIVAEYFRNGGGSLNCPSGVSGAGVSRVAVGAEGGSYAGASGGAAEGRALDMMMSQPWGEAAVANARRFGVTPEALAATCAIESGCRSDAAAGTTTASGPFQFVRDTWREQAQRAGVSTDLSARFDGAQSSAAAANYLAEGGRRLQQYGIDNPTVGQTRTLYQFGGAGMGLATAPDSAVVSVVMPGVSDATLRNNGIVPGVTTAGEWRAKGRGVAGSAFDAPVFPASNT